MAKLVIIYYSRSGNTEEMAEEVTKGARAVEGVEVVCKKAAEATSEDLLSSAGIIIGSPTYFRLMAAELKLFIDKSIDVYEKLGGKSGEYSPPQVPGTMGRSASPPSVRP